MSPNTYYIEGAIMKKIVFTGGGTGGHIMPNLSIILELKDKYEIYYLGSNGMEKDIISKYPFIKFIEIPCVKFIRAFTLKNLLIPFKLTNSISKCKKILKEISPDLIFSKGGFVSIPVCLAGQKLNITTLTHESDFTVGLANKIIAKKSKYILCSFKKTADIYGKNAIFTGSPIRKQIYLGCADKIRNKYNLDITKPIILVTGGSLGATPINNFIWDNINTLNKNYTIIHLVGKNKLNKKLPNGKNYVQLEFVDNIEDYFAISDIIISRAGSNTIFELLALKKLMLLIPLPKASSRGDQILNAEYFSEKNYAEYLLQEKLNLKSFLDKTDILLKTKSKYHLAQKNAPSADGTNNIIKIIKDNTK